MRRVVVTGMGTVNPIGLNVEEYWEGLKAGKTGFGEITYFDTTDFKVKVAAEVKGFVAADRMDKKAARRMEPFAQYAVAAAKEAFEDAGLDMEKEDPYRVGCAIGSGVGSLQSIEREHKKLLEKGPSRINPLLVPLMITNMATGNVTIQLGIKGKSINVVTACATGTHSIGEAFRSIQYGEADVMLAGGTENAITPIGVGGFTALTALSTSNNPERCSIPFDKDRDGFVIGATIRAASTIVSVSLPYICMATGRSSSLMFSFCSVLLTERINASLDTNSVYTISAPKPLHISRKAGSVTSSMGASNMGCLPRSISLIFII